MFKINAIPSTPLERTSRGHLKLSAKNVDTILDRAEAFEPISNAEIKILRQYYAYSRRGAGNRIEFRKAIANRLNRIDELLWIQNETVEVKGTAKVRREEALQAFEDNEFFLAAGLSNRVANGVHVPMLPIKEIPDDHPLALLDANFFLVEGGGMLNLDLKSRNLKVR